MATSNTSHDLSTASTSATTSVSTSPPRPRLTLPQPSFAPIPLIKTSPIPTRKHDTKTPKSSLYQCPLRHLSLRLASGRSTAYQSRNDPSASFYLYVPSSHPVSRRWHGDLDIRDEVGGSGSGNECDGRDEWDGYGEFKVVVLIHGSVRDAERLRNSWAERAEREGVVIVAPLWPGRIDFPHGPNGYKYLKYPEDGSPSTGTRYDLTLFDILEQVKQDWGFLDIDRFGLAGYSGGGQFVHRMLYLHPDRISAVSVGAPGSSTLISPDPWPRGTLDTKEIFGIATDPNRFNSTRIQIVVGSDDHYHPLNDDGTEFHMSRFGIAQQLHNNWIQNGVEHDWVVVEGGWHETDLFRPIVQDFIFRTGTGTTSS